VSAGYLSEADGKSSGSVADGEAAGGGLFINLWRTSGMAKLNRGQSCPIVGVHRRGLLWRKCIVTAAMQYYGKINLSAKSAAWPARLLWQSGYLIGGINGLGDQLSASAGVLWRLGSQSHVVNVAAAPNRNWPASAAEVSLSQPVARP